jgi:hypothetical protein
VKVSFTYDKWSLILTNSKSYDILNHFNHPNDNILTILLTIQCSRSVQKSTETSDFLRTITTRGKQLWSECHPTQFEHQYLNTWRWPFVVEICSERINKNNCCIDGQIVTSYTKRSRMHTPIKKWYFKPTLFLQNKENRLKKLMQEKRPEAKNQLFL